MHTYERVYTKPKLYKYATMTQKKIFICDDDMGIVNMLEMMLELTDANVITESNSLLAYDRLLAERPDVFIVDLWMPEMGGNEIIEKIRTSEELKDTYILCISASRDGELVAMKAGADIFLPKPFDMDEILTIVEGALETNDI